MNLLFKFSVLLSMLSFCLPVFANKEEFKFINYHFYDSFLDNSTNQLIESYLNKEIESIFTLNDDAIVYISQYTENGETNSIMMIDSSYDDIKVFEYLGELSIHFTLFDSYINISPLGEISFLDSQSKSILTPYKDSENYLDIYSSDEPPQNFLEFLMLMESFYQKDLLSLEDYELLINALLNE